MTESAMERDGSPIKAEAIIAGQTPIHIARDYLRANGLRLGTDILVNFVAPYLIYDHAKPAWGEVNALIASSGPPIGLLWRRLGSSAAAARKTRHGAHRPGLLGLGGHRPASGLPAGARRYDAAQVLGTGRFRGSARQCGVSPLHDGHDPGMGLRPRGRGGGLRRPRLYGQRSRIPHRRPRSRQRRHGRARPLDLLVRSPPASTGASPARRPGIRRMTVGAERDSRRGRSIPWCPSLAVRPRRWRHALEQASGTRLS
jgi:hypothetical protein